MTFDRCVILVMYLGVALALLGREAAWEGTLIGEIKANQSTKRKLIEDLLVLAGPGVFVAPIFTCFLLIQGSRLANSNLAEILTFSLFLTVALSPGCIIALMVKALWSPALGFGIAVLLAFSRALHLPVITILFLAFILSFAVRLIMVQ